MKYLFFVTTLILISCQPGFHRISSVENNWNKSGDARWNFADDLITGVASGDPGYIIAKNDYSNFILELEFKPDSTINSGVFLRCKNQEIGASTCFEVNIWDLHPNQDFRTGSIVTRAKPSSIIETIGKWNTYKIKCLGNRIQVWLNGNLTADIYEKELSEGIIALQAAGEGTIQFKSIRIKELNE